MKNMNAYKIILILFVSTVLLICCSDDFLNVSPTDTVNTEVFFKNQKDVEIALNALYASYSPNNPMEVYLLLIRNVASDDSWISGFGSFVKPIGDGSTAASEPWIENVYEYFYRVIRRANVILANIDEAEMEETTREQLRAEARFVRAWFYNELTFLWGDVVFPNKDGDDGVLTVENLVGIERSPRADVVNFVVSELEAAKGVLPAQPRLTGTATRGAANALLSRVYLTQGDYANAGIAAEAVMNSGTYSLFGNYDALFLKANENNSEVIFDVQYDNNGGYGAPLFNAQQVYINPIALGGWSGLSPGQSLVDTYETINGLTIDDPDNTLYDPANPYDNRDPRLDISIVTPLETLVNSSGENRVIDPWSGIDLYGGSNTTSTGYWVEKFIDNSIPPSDFRGVNLILIRLAEVMLNYAEARIEAGTIDQSVLDALNDIRSRAYGTNRSDTDNYPEITTMDPADLRTILRRERRVELAFEGARFYDIRRWRIAESVMPQDLLGAVNPNTGESVVGSTNRLFDASKHYLWPIPQAEINVSQGSIMQNSNW